MNTMSTMRGAGAAAAIAGFLALLPSAAHPAGPDGKAVFDKSCTACHSLMPPPKSAPPIAPIAMRYRQVFASKSQGVSHMVAFMKAPSKKAMVGDPQALARFGLMPPMQLSDAELKAVAEWVWDQGATGVGRGPGMGAGRGCVRQQ